MSQVPVPVLDEQSRERFSKSLGLIPQSLFVMTASHDNRVASLMVSWVQQASFNPPMVMVSLRKGRGIVPLVHDSHSFALNQIAADDRFLLRKYADGEPADDPLQAIDVMHKATGSPILARAASYLDCELVRHLDIDGDHDVYVGLVRDAGVLNDVEVNVHLREDGFSY